MHIVRGSHKSRPHSYTRPPPSGARPSIRWSLTAELDGCPLVLLSARNMAAVPTGALQGKEVLWEGRWRCPDGPKPRPAWVLPPAAPNGFYLVRWQEPGNGSSENYVRAADVRDAAGPRSKKTSARPRAKTSTKRGSGKPTAKKPSVEKPTRKKPAKPAAKPKGRRLPKGVVERREVGDVCDQWVILYTNPDAKDRIKTFTAGEGIYWGMDTRGACTIGPTNQRKIDAATEAGAFDDGSFEFKEPRGGGAMAIPYVMQRAGGANGPHRMVCTYRSGPLAAAVIYLRKLRVLLPHGWKTEGRWRQATYIGLPP